MFNRIIFYNGSSGGSAPWGAMLAQGLFFILFGLLIVLVPQLLVVLISTFFIAIGAFLVLAAWRARSLSRMGPPPFWP